MRILFLNYEYPPLGGGAGNATENILREFAKQSDLEVHLVTSSLDSETHVDSIGGAVTVHRVPIGKHAGTIHFQSQKDLLTYTFVGYRYAKKLLTQMSFDVILAFFSVPCGAQAFLLGQRFHLPYIVCLRGSDVPGFSDRYPWLYLVLRPLIRFVWKHAGAVIAASEGLRELAQRTAPQREISVIPNGIAAETFPVSLGSQDGVFRIISTSRLTPRKGLSYCIEAVARLKAANTAVPLELILVGDGNQRSQLEQLAAARGVSREVRFIGAVEHRRLSDWYTQADAFILPSFNEGMSNAMLEALASGLPLIVTRTGGTAEVLGEGINGLEIKMGSSEDIAEKIQLLGSDPELRRRMSEASRHKALELSWGRVAQQYVEVCNALTNRNVSS